MSTFFKHFRSSFNNRGFTLIELLVVVAVISIITAFLLFNQNKFNSSTLMRSLAYSVALSIRQAQLYGVSVRGFGSATSPSFAPGYGVYFDNANTFTLFADTNGDGAYTAGEGLTGVGGVLVSIGRGYSIGRFCAISSSGVQDCYPSANGGGTISNMTIYFKRPNPDAAFSATCGSGCSTPYTSAYIQVKSAGNSDTRSIKITSTGQITVCPLNVAPPNC
ncbi:MAG TPA: prepilin-type N-terminal cleavage/methylation domain-containing protein [Candidatus Paceibacterota bacterium]